MNILACGALANELVALKKMNGWDAIKITCLPAHYHQTPNLIPGAVKDAIDKIRRQNNDEILVAYGDCGTGGRLDVVLGEAGVQRLPGAHCYEFFAGSASFHAMHEAEIGTFYLTDFLVRQFDTFVMKALGLDRKPELRDMYFGNYKRLMYLAQMQDDSLQKLAQDHAKTLGLSYDYCYTAYGEMGSEISRVMHVSAPVAA